MILKMMDEVIKPALAGLWPSKMDECSFRS
jgi:hypothetical protein